MDYIFPYPQEFPKAVFRRNLSPEAHWDLIPLRAILFLPEPKQSRLTSFVGLVKQYGKLLLVATFRGPILQTRTPAVISGCQLSGQWRSILLP